jgi:DNA-binding GntR family transcriptional regulator
MTVSIAPSPPTQDISPVVVTQKVSTRQTPTVIEKCVKRLRGAIMVGHLRPGQKLIEADLRDELSVSRSSLREALRVLERERLVELVPNRGPSVAKLGQKEIEDIHEVWALLTGEAVFDFVQIATAQDIARLASIVVQLKQSLRAKDPLRQLNVTNAFFGYIYLRCKNAVLVDLVSTLVSRLNFLRAQSLMHEGWRELCAQEIGDIMTAVKAKSPAKARLSVQRHIASACEAATKIAAMPNPPRARSIGNIARFATMERWTPTPTRRATRGSDEGTKGASLEKIR